MYLPVYKKVPEPTFSIKRESTSKIEADFQKSFNTNDKIRAMIVPSLYEED